MTKRKLGFAVALATALMCAGCWEAAAVFNQPAYDKAVTLKVDALFLMDKATQPFDSCKSEVVAFKREFSVACEYAKGLPNNEETVKQFEIIGDPKKNSLYGFLARWESKGQLSAAFISDAKGLVSDGFDMVIGLETGKKKPK